MKITVFGCGYVGLTTAVGLAEMGNEVIGVDTDEKKIQTLKKGRVPFYEPGMRELLQRNIKEGRIVFTADQRRGIEESGIIFSAVGTPPRKDRHADLTAVLKVAQAFGKYGSEGKIFVNKSTVPVGTSRQIRRTIENASRIFFSFHVVSNPEFLREGTAVQDFFTPDRIVIGLEKEHANLKKTMRALYRPMAGNGVPILFTDIRSAEVIKYASNAYLAMRISFINELANFCEIAGADIRKVAKGTGLDKRIGTHYLEAGIGFGGSCLPKDLNALIEIGKKNKFNFELLKAVQNINKNQATALVDKLKKLMPVLKGKTVAIWGLAFKPKTDDVRDAPSISVIKKLLLQKAHVQVYDPAAVENIKALFGDLVHYYNNYYSVLSHADALLILTDWDEFRSPDYKKMREIMKSYYILDGRNILEPAEAAENGFIYIGIGRAKNQRLSAVSDPPCPGSAG